MTGSSDSLTTHSESDDIVIRWLEADVESIRSMWTELYVHQRQHGLLADVPDGAFDLWARSHVSVLGRFGFVAVASSGGIDLGFCAGRMRPMPPQFGSGYVGYISDVYTETSARGVGVGRLLVEAGVAWFREREISRVELHVVWQNLAAIDFYRHLGWVEEFIQFVKLPD